MYFFFLLFLHLDWALNILNLSPDVNVTFIRRDKVVQSRGDKPSACSNKLLGYSTPLLLKPHTDKTSSYYNIEPLDGGIDLQYLNPVI